MKGMNIAFFGSSLRSTYWNGAATYYRGLIHALHDRGHRVTFYEPDAFERQQHRDIDPPPWARVHVYAADEQGVCRALEAARGADMVVKASGVGVFDEFLESAVLDLQSPSTLVAFWDVDAPATLDRVKGNPRDAFHACIPRYDVIFTYGGGLPVIRAYEALGAERCVPIYNALDPSTHHPVPPRARFRGILGFLGNRLPDREARVREFFFRAAESLPGERFVMGGSGWNVAEMPRNVSYLGHVSMRHHNPFNVSSRAVLNINRSSMAQYGFSPPTRVFEAAGAGACLISDAWDGIEMFLEPGEEVLIARSGDEVAEHLRGLGQDQARAMGERARKRVMAEHTYEQRAVDVEAALGALRSSRRSVRPVIEQPASRAPASLKQLDIVILGLSITSSWGNGHATTYRALVRELCARGHEVLFLERDTPWYAANRDLPEPPYGRTELYTSLTDLESRFVDRVQDADVVIIGSYVPDGVAVAQWVQDTAHGITAFYDIDTPVTLAKLEAGDFEYLAPDLIPHFDLYLSFTGGPTLRLLTERYHARRALPLYCSVDPELYYPERPEGPQRMAPGHGHAAKGKTAMLRWDMGYMGTHSNDRLAALERLLIAPAQKWPSGRFIVAGPLYPESIEWPANVERVDHVPPAQHCTFYHSLGFALNITRHDMIQAGFSPSVRLFEAAACAVPVISDDWQGLETFFEIGKEILVAQSTEDVLRYLGTMTEEDRVLMGQRARARVMAEHTAVHRAATLERYLSEAMATRLVSHDRLCAGDAAVVHASR